MSFPESLNFTNGGREVQLKALSGGPLIFTSVRLGDGEMTGTISAKTALISERASVNVNTVSANSDYATIDAIFKNSDLSSAFYWKELGVFVANPDAPNDRNADILYAYQNVGELAELIPSPSAELIEKIIHIPVFIGDVDTVSIAVNSIVQQEATVTQDEESTIEDVDSLTFYDASDIKNKRISFANFRKKTTEELSGELAKKAPAGYGLGTMCKSIDKITDITENGWWVTNGDTPDGNWWVCISFAVNNSKDIIVKAWNLGGSFSAKCSKISGEWQPWEWENPPLYSDTEYRTTERHGGKPVYYKSVSFGSGPNNTTKIVEHGAKNVLNVLEWHCYNVNSGTNVEQATHVTTVTVSNTTISVTTNDNEAAWTLRFIIKYTKTTD